MRKPYLWPICFAIILTVLSMDGLALLFSECADINYVGSAADYIIEGTVKKVESKLVNDEYGFNGQSVFTYNDLTIEKYVKGIPLKENSVQIVTRGGTAVGISQWVEDEPTFYEGIMVRVYLRETNGNFSLVCSEYGVEEILPPEIMAGAPVEVWSRTFGGKGSDYAYYTQQTADGGYIITGQTSSYGSGDFDAWLIKTDAKGIEQWNKTFGGTFQDSTYFVQQTPDGGFIFAGSRSYRNYGYEAMLIKTDGSGNLQWIRPFRGLGFGSAHSINMTEDGGFALAGYTAPYLAANSYGWLIKIDRGVNGEANAPVETTNETSSDIPTSGLTPAKSETEEVPEKKASGFGTFPVIIALSAVIVFGRKKAKI